MTKHTLVAACWYICSSFACSEAHEEAGPAVPGWWADAGMTDGAGGSPSDGSSDSSKEAQAVALGKVPVSFEYVVDGTSSMSNDFDGLGSKRSALEQTLKTFLSQVSSETVVSGKVVAGSSALGMIYFGPMVSYPTSDDVAPAVVDERQLARLLARVDKFPGGAAPTFDALSAGYRVLDELPRGSGRPAGGDKFLVLITDGIANERTAEMLSLARLKSAAEDPIRTLVVQIGGGLGPDTKFLSDLAIAGVTPRKGCDPSAADAAHLCHSYVKADGLPASQVQQQLQRSLDSTVHYAVACAFDLALANAGRSLDWSTLTVSFKSGADQTVRQIANDSEGWQFDGTLPSFFWC